MLGLESDRLQEQRLPFLCEVSKYKDEEVFKVLSQEVHPKVSHIGLNGAVGAVILIENRCKVDILLLMRFARGQFQKAFLILSTRIASLVVAI